jgi:hypothetical protein
MRLVPCTPPTEPLDQAPSTALMRDVDTVAEWEGFWGIDSYYARRTSATGAVDWFRMDDGGSVETAAVQGPPARVLPFRSDAMRRQTVIVAEMPGGRPMLVGSSRKTARQ